MLERDKSCSIGLTVGGSATKVAIVGAGAVGCSTAYALMLMGVVSEIALIDPKVEKAQGEALDLSHCRQFTDATLISAGDDFSLVKGASIIIIAAGLPQRPGQSRDDLLQANTAIFKQIIPEIIAYNREAILLVVTNPLDIMTYVSLKLSGLPVCRVFGTGTVLDTARLRFMLGEHFRVSPKDVIAYVLGEHGESEFAWWSSATVAGVSLTHMVGYDAKIMGQLLQRTKQAADEIIAKKGATYYAIALVVAKIVRAILHNQSRVFSVSTLVHNVYGANDLCLSVPTVVRQDGICEQLPFVLDMAEEALFRKSAQKVARELEKIAHIF